MIHNFLQSCRLLQDASRSFREYCVAGLEPNEPVIARHLADSLMVVTALAPHIGYDRAAAIAKRAHHEGKKLRETALAMGVSAADYDKHVVPEEMTRPSG
jgi:fumarate hydratase class II